MAKQELDNHVALMKRAWALNADFQPTKVKSA
jgi:hypothetical protein